MKYVTLTAFLFMGVAAFAQDVLYDYNRSVNFGAYKTYQWVDYRQVNVGDQLLDQDIKRAVDEQLAGKGLRRVESGGDLLVGYQAGKCCYIWESRCCGCLENCAAPTSGSGSG